MKFSVGERVKFTSATPYTGFTYGKTYTIATTDNLGGEYYVYNDNAVYDRWAQTPFEAAFISDPITYPSWNPYAPVYASDYITKDVKKCTCGCASLEITEIDRHSSYCDLKSNPKIGNWKWT